MKAIVNTKLIMEDGIIWDGAITWEGDRIVQVGWASEVQIPEGTEVIDAKGLYTAPGFVDIHNHGSTEHLFSEEPLKAAEHFLKHGETTILPTFYCSLTLDQMLEGAKRVRAVSQTGAGGRLRQQPEIYPLGRRYYRRGVCASGGRGQRYGQGLGNLSHAPRY